MPNSAQRAAAALPNALHDHAALERAFGRLPLRLFLDYDGTLAPISARPEDARLAPPGRAAVRRVARRYPTAIVSGRELADIRHRVGLTGLYYSGNHGFEIAGPPSSGLDWQYGATYVAQVESAARALRACLPAIDGLILEHKRYSVSVHYRLVPDDQVPALQPIVSAVLTEYPELTLRHGKRIFEIRPNVDWHKGKAVRRLMEIFGDTACAPIFVGDDLTDEDAFQTLADDGIGIIVGTIDRLTAASFRLDDTSQVYALLERLADR